MYSIKQHIESLQNKHAEIVHNSEKQTSEYIDLLEKAEPIIIKIEKAFNKIGFNIQSFGCQRTGINNEGDSLRIYYQILPKSPTYRYIKFDGYDKRGAGKNQPRLVKRAKDLQDRILLETGLKCEVNHYSFELDRGEEKGGTILVDFWINKE